MFSNYTPEQSVSLSHELLRELDSWAIGSQEEICGFIFGEVASNEISIKGLKLAKNISPLDRKRHYFIAAEDYLLAEREADENGEVLLGIFHTHLNQSPVPSQTDIKNSLPEFIYLILSVFENKNNELMIWELQPNVRLLNFNCN